MLKRFTQETGSDFYVLGCGAEQALLAEAIQPAHFGIEMTVQLLGVGEPAHHGLCVARVNGFDALHQAVFVDALLAALPGMSRDDFDMVCALRAVFEKGTVLA